MHNHILLRWYCKQREKDAATATKKTLAPYDVLLKLKDKCFICINRLVSSTANLTIKYATKNQKIGATYVEGAVSKRIQTLLYPQ